MRPLHTNLAVLAVLVGVALLLFLATGPGLAFEVTITVIGVFWFVQFAALAWSAYQLRPDPPFANKTTFALWGAVTLPLNALDVPNIFPSWFVVASFPLGYLIIFACTWGVLELVRLQRRALRGKE